MKMMLILGMFKSLISRILLELPNSAVLVAQIAQVSFQLSSFYSLLFLHFPPEPLMFRLIIEKEGGITNIFYGLFEPKGILPPRGGLCESLYQTNEGVGEGEGIVSGLSFVVVRCWGWMYADGDLSVLGHRVYYESTGSFYPRNQTGIYLFRATISIFCIFYFIFSQF